MLKLSKLCSLISRNATVTLADSSHKEAYFNGSVKDIPDAYDSWVVNDIIGFSNYDFMIEIKPNK